MYAHARSKRTSGQEPRAPTSRPRWCTFETSSSMTHDVIVAVAERCITGNRALSTRETSLWSRGPLPQLVPVEQLSEKRQQSRFSTRLAETASRTKLTGVQLTLRSPVSSSTPTQRFEVNLYPKYISSRRTRETNIAFVYDLPHP